MILQEICKWTKLYLSSNFKIMVKIKNTRLKKFTTAQFILGIEKATSCQHHTTWYYKKIISISNPKKDCAITQIHYKLWLSI